MQQIIFWSVLSLLLLVFCTATLAGGFRRKSKGLKIVAVLALIVSLGLAGRSVYRFVRRSYRNVTRALRPRTGEEIYAALFGAPADPCVKVLQHQDQVVPKIDYAIWLHFRTCPEELARMLRVHPFRVERLPTARPAGAIPYGETLDWFRPNALGDTVLVFEYATADGRNIQTIWARPDSTEAYCRDVWD